MSKRNSTVSLQQGLLLRIKNLLLIPLLAFMCRSQLNFLAPAKEEILWAADWSPDGQVIAVGGTYDSLMLVHKESNLDKSYALPHTITKLKWHPNGKLLAIATQGEGAGLYLLDVADGNLRALDSGESYGCRAVGWNADGTKLAVGYNDGSLTIRSVDGPIITRIESTQKVITGLSWHPSKDMVVTVGHHIELHSLSDGNSLSIKPRDEEALMLSVAWHPSGEFFVTGDYGDHQVGHSPLLQYWSPEGKEIRRNQQSRAEFRNLAWKSDGSILATASDALRLWSKDGDLISESIVPDLLWGISWSPDDEHIVATTKAGHILIYSGTGILEHQLTR